MHLCNYWFTRAGAESLPLPGRALPGGRGELPAPSALSGTTILSNHKMFVATSRPLEKETVLAHVWIRNLRIAMSGFYNIFEALTKNYL